MMHFENATGPVNPISQIHLLHVVVIKGPNISKFYQKDRTTLNLHGYEQFQKSKINMENYKEVLTTLSLWWAQHVVTETDKC